MKLESAKTVTTDVLVIGGGGAGIFAAIEARKGGAEVTLVCKGKTGNSGNTIMIGGSYSMDGYSAKHVYGFPEADDSLTQKILLEQIIKQGFYLGEQDVAREYVEDSPAAVYDMFKMTERVGGRQIFMAPGAWLVSGHDIGRGLQQGIKENPGINVVNDVMILDLLRDGKRVSGAVGVDVYTGEIIVFCARAVIMATGGYQPFSVKNTNSDMTGDGIAMAYRAGAQLADMEFLLPCPTALEPAPIRGSLMPFMYEVIAGVTLPSMDKNGVLVEIPENMRAVAEGSELEKLITTYYWSEAIAQGRGLPGDAMYYDFTPFSDREIDESFQSFMTMMGEFYRAGYYHGDSILQYRDFIKANGKRVKVGSIFEYTMGGIVIDRNMETTLPGLLAAGEAGSGVFGACRIADATTEMLVQGRRAGKTAAERYLQDDLPAIHAEEIERILAHWTAPFERRSGDSGAELIHATELACDEGFGICRTEKNMRASIARLEALEESAGELRVESTALGYNIDWHRCIQGQNQLTCALAGLRSAVERRESRGFHMRHDFRAVDNTNFAKRSIISLRDGRMQLSYKVADQSLYPIPEGGSASIPEYIVEQDLNFKNADFKS